MEGALERSEVYCAPSESGDGVPDLSPVPRIGKLQSWCSTASRVRSWLGPRRSLPKPLNQELAPPIREIRRRYFNNPTKKDSINPIYPQTRPKRTPRGPKTRKITSLDHFLSPTLHRPSIHSPLIESETIDTSRRNQEMTERQEKRDF